MSFVFDLAQSVGTFTLEVLWFPLLVWTVISGLLVLLVRKTTVLAPLYHYHIRVAMLFALPLGISGVALLSAISKLIPETHSSIQAITYSVYAPIYIQLSPATETSYSLLSELTVNHAVGIITIGLLVISVVFLIRLTADFARLQRIRSAVPGSSINQIEGFEEYDANIKVAHIRDDVVPFTFGCFNPVIILPESLKQDTDKQALTLRHELVHIERQDYALQLIITFIRSVFWFHPLVSFLEKEIELHRETSCDLQVLSSSASSAKTYAAMLYELSLSPSPKLSVTVGMALSPSTLKQRLQLMTSSSTYIQSLKKSMALLMLVTVSVMLPMACSDLTNQNADLPESLSDGTQPPISLNLSSKNSENYIVYVDGKQVEHESINSIDANDIQSVTLNKSEEGKSTIRIITKTNSDKNSSSTKVNVFSEFKSNTGDDVFVVVEQAPEVVGGLASIQQHLLYPEEAKNAGVEGRVIVQFIVEPDGSVQDIEVTQGLGSGCDEAALEAIKAARFEPGIQRGRAVRTKMTIPIVFSLENEG